MTTTRGPRLVADELVGALVDPASIVVVGASSDIAKSSSRPLQYLSRLGYQGAVTVVNPRHRSVMGFGAISSIADMRPGAAEVAIVNVGAFSVTDVLHELDDQGVGAAVVIGSGFERGDSVPRADLQAFLAHDDRRLRVIGPNCVGTMSMGSGAHLNFSSVLQTEVPRAGSVALVTQSGATGNGILMSLLRRGIGVSHWFSTGNEMDTGALELVAGLLSRNDVTAIGLFLEAVTDLQWLPAVTELMKTTGKPVFLVKVAVSDLGQVAAGGHTGRVVGSSDVANAVLDQAGFVRTAGIAELCDCLVLSDIIGDLSAPVRISAVSVSGASAVIVSDAIRDSTHLELAAWDSRLTEELGILSGGRLSDIANPLDIPFLGETSTFANISSSLSAAGVTDVVVAVQSSLAHDRGILAEGLDPHGRSGAAIILTHLSEDDTIPVEIVSSLADRGVAVVPTPERAIRALDLLAHEPNSAHAREDGAAHTEPLGRQMGLDDVAAMLPDDFPWAPWTLVRSGIEADSVAARYGFPVAVKAAGRTISHRSELGAVAVVHDMAELKDAYARVAAVCDEHDDVVVIQAGAGQGHEVLVALVRDAEYGPVIIVRLGGTLVELLEDQVILWSGWSPKERRQVLISSRVGRILGGYRGQPAGDLAALCDVIDTLLASIPQTTISLLELNPLIVLSDGVRAVDALAYDKRTGDKT